MVGPTDRRARARLGLRREIRVRRLGKRESVHTYTENVTSEGFCCVVPEPFSPGEDLDCLLYLEIGPFSGRAARLVIQAQVRWAQPLPKPSGFAIGCKIRSYSFLRDTEQLSDGFG